MAKAKKDEREMMLCEECGTYHYCEMEWNPPKPKKKPKKVK